MDNEEVMEKMISIAEMVRNLGEADRAWRLMHAATDVAFYALKELERDEAIWKRKCAEVEDELDKLIVREE